ncbi:MAG: hypothetical protein IT294_10045 [Deltaproteobacteria bacterium]|nr:hypothetical protein [Deltaproteobacteria bacterium]
MRAVLAAVLAVALARGADASARDPAASGELHVALDQLVARARPDGGWEFGELPGERVHPHTAPLKFAERVAAPFGLADWDLLAIRSPGTPTAILALVDGYRLTGDERYRATAARGADLLAAIQMRSGGWFSEMPVRGPALARWFTWTVLRTALDDDVTPGAIRALLAVWQLNGAPHLHAAAERGIAFLLDRQLADGAWPLVARPRWKQWVYRDFEDRPTLNDGATSQTIVTLLAAAAALDRPELVAAARRGGDWIARARHAPPQAGWAQQYDEGGVPVAARRYERVALASWETRHALTALVALADATGDPAYCAPIAPAVRWLEQSQITPGCWARFYEIGTNRPLYFNERREAVGTPSEAHQPYDWSGEFGIPYLVSRLGAGDGEAREMAHAARPRVPGDPGVCRSAAAAAFDPVTAADPRQVIAYAGTLVAEATAEPPSVCRVSRGR